MLNETCIFITCERTDVIQKYRINFIDQYECQLMYLSPFLINLKTVNESVHDFNEQQR